MDLRRPLELLVAAAGAPESDGLADAVRALGGDANEDDLALVREIGIRAFASARGLPVQLTLGAAVVLDAAERSQNRGDTQARALEHATEAAFRLIELVPERTLAAASTRGRSDSGRPVASGGDGYAIAPNQQSIKTTEEVT